MLKVPKAEATEQPEFQMADSFLKSCVQNVASYHVTDAQNETKEVQLERHFRLVASLARNYLFILETLNQDLLEKFKGMKGNILSINKFLALRQLTETQLKGVTQGTWDIQKDGVSSSTFQKVTAESQVFITTSSIVNFLERVEQVEEVN